MSSKIYTVWGGKNSGKTTFAVNLACTLSRRNVLVGLISSNLTYGDIQVFLGQSVPAEKGLFLALSEDNPNIAERFMQYEESKNLFFLSVPTHYTGLLCEAITLQEVERMLNAASLVFDILIVDGAAEVTNPVSGVGLWVAERIYTLHKPSIAAQMWYRGVTDFMRELQIIEKQTHILLEPNREFDDKTYRKMLELPFTYELPHIKRAGELENAGTPIVFFRDRLCRRYIKVLEKIADEIGGGKP
ncbi:MAG: hypothetical protein PHV12_03320 [Bacteroidales bacterium]|nr:hypothetical protein [Bacteroidales bacterium]MDD4833397.1 cobalamin biosynthesis protein CobQ [Lutispora sp.]